MIKHWRTTLLGVVAIALGLWAMHVTYVPTQTFKFNLLYVWTGPLALVTVGIGLLFAADAKHS